MSAGTGGTHDVALAYDRWAVNYDDSVNRTRDLDAETLRTQWFAAREALAAMDVLELGCGTGKNTRLLSAARSLTCLDLSEGMLARAREAVRAPHVRFVQHDLRNPWPVADASVDLVCGNLVLEHIASLAHVMRESARVLRKGGTLYLAELHPHRQLRGGQAHFTDAASGETVHVPAYIHTVSEFVNDGIGAGLTLQHLGEELEVGAPSDAPPRLLTIRFTRG